jgi:GAF domain-containing protein
MDEPFLPELPTLLEAQVTTDLTPAAQGALLLDEAAIAVNASKLAAMEGFASLLGRDMNYSTFASEVLLVFLKAVKCEAGSLFEASPDGSFLFFRAASGQSSEQLSEIRIPAGKGIVGHVQESRQIIHVADCTQDERFLRTVGDVVGFQTRNLVAAPIVIRNRVFGVIELLNHRGDGSFTEEEIGLVTYLCEAASKFIEARLVMNWVASRASQEVGSADKRAA